MNELDKRIAELLGWTLRPARRGELVKMDKLDPTFNDPTDTMIWVNTEGKLQRFERTYQPSKVTGQAMELLNGLFWELGCVYGVEGIVCGITTEAQTFEATAKTPEEAIALAWIKYKEAL